MTGASPIPTRIRWSRVFGTIGVGLLVVISFGCWNGCARFGRAADNGRAAEAVLARIAARTHANVDELRADVAAEATGWAESVGRADYLVLIARRGERFERVLARGFDDDEVAGHWAAKAFAGGRPESTAMCLQGPPLVHSNVEVVVGDAVYVVEIDNFGR